MRVSYLGNRSTHLPWYNYPINLSQQQIPGTLQPNRPYQPWADILVLASGGDSTMHQLQLEATKRYASGLTFQLEILLDQFARRHAQQSAARKILIM